MRVLIIEDNQAILKNLEKGLLAARFMVDAEVNFKDGLHKAEVNKYDLIALDVNLPDGNGLDILKTLRGDNNEVSIIIMTINSKVQDRVKGLNLGADDYIVKPFAIDEFVARAKALTRRDKNIKSSAIQIGELRLDPISFEVTFKDKKIDFVKKEFILLEYLLRNKGNVITRPQLWEHVWGVEEYPLNNSVDVHIASLRKKLKEYTDKDFIQTVRGIGYKIA